MMQKIKILLTTVLLISLFTGCSEDEEVIKVHNRDTITDTIEIDDTITDTVIDNEDTIANTELSANMDLEYSFLCSKDLLELVNPIITYKDNEGTHTCNIENFYIRDDSVANLYQIPVTISDSVNKISISYERTNNPIENKGYVLKRKLYLSSGWGKIDGQYYSYIGININIGNGDNKLYGSEITEYINEMISTTDSLSVTLVAGKGFTTSNK